MTSRDDESLATRDCNRAYRLDDLHLRSDGSGRVVEAYAAVFRTKTEVMDQDGHYHEELAPTSFAKTLQENKPGDFRVLFNHGRTIDGTPNALATMPIGVPLEIRADERGVYTVTRYLDNPLANDVLEAIKAGAIKAQSFSGRFLKSFRSWPDGRGRAALPLITRHEVQMREYGPAVFAAYTSAAILGTRSVRFMEELLATPPGPARLQLLEQFEGITTPTEPDAPILDTPDDGAVTQAAEPREHSTRADVTSFREQLRAKRARLGA
jgi:HK97 family phage prohead protease